jgi:hypothetical protein
MRILVCTLGLTAATSMAMAGPPPTHPTPAPKTVQTHGHPHTTTPKTTTTSTVGSTTTGSTTTTSVGTSTTTTLKLNPIATKISSSHGLSSKVATMLSTITNPKTGKPITLNAASTGFKNQGQFIAALHVSQNLGIPFLDLKKAMVTSHTTARGTTMSQTGSLGQAIQKVKGTTDTRAVTTAQKQADDDLNTATPTTSTTSTTSGSTTTRKTGSK